MPLLAPLAPLWQAIKAPRILAGIAGVMLVGGVFWFWLSRHDDAVIDKHEAKVMQQVETKTDHAAIAASNAVAQSNQEVEQSNANARNAAARSDDPLRAALTSIRSNTRKETSRVSD